MFLKYEYRSKPIFVTARDYVLKCPARFHKQLEMIWVKSGELNAVIGGKNYTLRAHDLYLVFPNTLHAIHPSDVSSVLVIADNELFPAFHEILTHYTPETPVLRSDELPPIITDIFLRIGEWAQREDSRHKQTTLTWYIGAVLGEVLSGLKLVERNSDENLVQKLILYLVNNYTREISLEDAARELNYNKCYISHLIANTFQCNFRTLINSYRISLAQSLLLTTSKTVSIIAYECGFQNQSSFNRVFLKHCNVTPSQFRKSNHHLHREAPSVLHAHN